MHDGGLIDGAAFDVEGRIVRAEDAKGLYNFADEFLCETAGLGMMGCTQAELDLEDGMKRRPEGACELWVMIRDHDTRQSR